MKLFFTLNFFFIYLNLSAQLFQTTVNFSFPTGINLCIESTDDGGYILFNGLQSSDLVITKVDSFGNVSWTKSYFTFGMDAATTIGENRFAVYGNYVINYWPFQITSALHIIDSSGIVLYNYLIPESLIVNIVHPTSDGGIVALSGAYVGDATRIFKNDSLGALEWIKRIDSHPPNYHGMYLSDIIESPEGGYFGIANYYYPDTNTSIPSTLLVRFDSLCDTLWTKTFDSNTWGCKLLNAPSTDYLIYGDQHLTLIDSSGTIKWSKFTQDIYLSDCILSSDSSFIVCGSSYDITSQAMKTCLIKVDTNGVVQWLHWFSKVGYNVGPLVKATASGITFVSDFDAQQFTLIKTDVQGHANCDSTLGIPVFEDSVFFTEVPMNYAIHPINMQRIDTLGTPYPITYPPFTQINNCLLLGKNEIYTTHFAITVSPNPAIEQFAVRSSQIAKGQLEIFNSLGEKIYSALFNLKQKINCENFPRGIYFVRLSNKDSVLTEKLLIE